MSKRSWLTGSPGAAVVLPIIGLIGAIALWWLATIAFSIEPFLLPSPGDVISKFSEQPVYLLKETGVSLLETIEGFVLAIVIGVPIAIVIVRSAVLERLVYPLLLMVNAIPKIAVAPLLVVWMGFGQLPKVVMVLLMCFFPVVISTAQGMKSTPVELVELLRSLNASRAQEFFKLRLRYAMPQIFTGLEGGDLAGGDRFGDRRVRRRHPRSRLRDPAVRRECRHHAGIRRDHPAEHHEHRLVLQPGPARAPLAPVGAGGPMTVLLAGPSAPAWSSGLGSRPSLVAPVAALPALLSPGREAR